MKTFDIFGENNFKKIKWNSEYVLEETHGGKSKNRLWGRYPKLRRFGGKFGKKCPRYYPTVFSNILKCRNISHTILPVLDITPQSFKTFLSAIV